MNLYKTLRRIYLTRRKKKLLFPIVFYRWTNSSQSILPNLLEYETRNGLLSNFLYITNCKGFRTERLKNLKLFKIFYETQDVVKPHTGFVWFQGNLYSMVKLYETSQVSCDIFYSAALLQLPFSDVPTNICQ